MFPNRSTPSLSLHRFAQNQPFRATAEYHARSRCGSETNFRFSCSPCSSVVRVRYVIREKSSSSSQPIVASCIWRKWACLGKRLPLVFGALRSAANGAHFPGIGVELSRSTREQVNWRRTPKGMPWAWSGQNGRCRRLCCSCSVTEASALRRTPIQRVLVWQRTALSGRERLSSRRLGRFRFSLSNQPDQVRFETHRRCFKCAGLTQQ